MTDLQKYLIVYRSDYPTAEDPEKYFLSLGYDLLLDILKEAAGREIVFTYETQEGIHVTDPTPTISYR